MRSTPPAPIDWDWLRRPRLGHGSFRCRFHRREAHHEGDQIQSLERVPEIGCDSSSSEVEGSLSGTGCALNSTKAGGSVPGRPPPEGRGSTSCVGDAVSSAASRGRKPSWARNPTSSVAGEGGTVPRAWQTHRHHLSDPDVGHLLGVLDCHAAGVTTQRCVSRTSSKSSASAVSSACAGCWQF